MSTDQVSKIKKNANIFLASNYFAVIMPQVKKLELNNVFNVYELIKETDYKDIISSTDQEIHNFGEVKRFPFNQRPIEIERVLDAKKRTTLISDETRVYKGGSWADREYWLDPAQRRYLPQYMATNYIGFRCVTDKLGPMNNNDSKTTRNPNR